MTAVIAAQAASPANRLMADFSGVSIAAVREGGRRNSTWLAFSYILPERLDDKVCSLLNCRKLYGNWPDGALLTASGNSRGFGISSPFYTFVARSLHVYVDAADILAVSCVQAIRK